MRSLTTVGPLLILTVAISACGPRPVPDATFAGSTIRIIVGYPPGGGYDLHARLAARRLGQFLPGNPAVVVENMPGAGGALAANYLATAATPDGLSVGVIGEASAPDLVASKRLERLALLGSPGATAPAIAFARRSGIASVDDWRRATTPPRLGSAGGQALSSVVPRVVSAALELPMRLVSGYSGISEIRLALESGEVDGCAFDDAIVRSDQLGDAVVVLRFGPQSIGRTAAAPDALSLTSNPRAGRLLEAGVYGMKPFGRVFIAPRNVPRDRLDLLRTALANVWADAGFLAEAKTAGLFIAPISAEDLEQAADKLLAANDEGLRAILGGN